MPSTFTRPAAPKQRHASSSALWPRVSQLHMISIAAMIALVLIGSVAIPMIDHETLKPSTDFPTWLKAISFYSNIPIKLGLVHVVLYGYELYYDPQSAQRHLGQRLSTMWLQFFEHPRWGQHFHMQLETVLQVCDIFVRRDERLHPRPKPSGENAPDPLALGLGAIAFLMALTNLITSCCYHTLSEQLIGAFLALGKLLAFDYHVDRERFNPLIGEVYTNPLVLVLSTVGVALLVLGLQAVFAGFPVVLVTLMHPTTLATAVFLGCHAARSLLATANTQAD